MILRKINAWISLVITLLLLGHAISNAIWMLSGGSIVIRANIMPIILFVLMIIHAAICIAFAILGHKGAEKRKCKSYADLNKSAYIQRTTGILLIPLTVLHILGAVGIMHTPQAVHAILSPLFFSVCMLHAAISTTKAFITLGIGNAMSTRIVDITIKTICAVTLSAVLVGFYLYLV